MTPSTIARALGRRGGMARARRLSSAERTRIAASGARARIESLQITCRIVANFRYAEAVRQLRGERTRVERVSRFTGRLPGLYRNQP